MHKANNELIKKIMAPKLNKEVIKQKCYIFIET